MAQICDVNWETGCGAMNGFWDKLTCWLGCNTLGAVIIGGVIVGCVIIFYITIKKSK